MARGALGVAPSGRDTRSEQDGDDPEDLPGGDGAGRLGTPTPGGASPVTGAGREETSPVGSAGAAPGCVLGGALVKSGGSRLVVQQTPLEPQCLELNSASCAYELRAGAGPPPLRRRRS